MGKNQFFLFLLAATALILLVASGLALVRTEKNIAVSLSPSPAPTLARQLQDCLPKSDMESARICQELLDQITSYQDCIQAGFPQMDSQPPQCQTADGRTFAGEVNEEEAVACTMDAKMCPDGSWVGRIAPDCEFAPCPGN